jgi:glycine/D-amino acid oxidase-like deaminating enzyme
VAILVLGGAGYIGSHAARALRRSGYEVVLYDNPSQSKFRSPSIRRASRSIPMASKLSFENALEAYSRAYGLRSVSLRYFNAAGADESGEIGEKHEPETHLIPTGAGRLHRERTRVANLRVRLLDRGRDLPSRRGGFFPDKKRNRAVGPGFGSAGCDAFTSHGAAGSENGGRGSRPLVHLAPAKCSKERGNMRKRRSNYGASVMILCSRFNGFCNLKK